MSKGTLVSKEGLSPSFPTDEQAVASLSNMRDMTIGKFLCGLNMHRWGHWKDVTRHQSAWPSIHERQCALCGQVAVWKSLE